MPSYFGVKQAFEEEGHKFFLPKLTSIASAEVRGSQLRDAAEEAMAITGAKKVNLIGHSFGGFDVRYAAHLMGAGKVASVTALSTPHRGLYTVDLAWLLVHDVIGASDLGEGLIEVFVWIAGGWIINGDPSLHQDAYGALRQMTTEYAAQWNQVISNIPGVYYQSWNGDTPVTNLLDPTDYLFGVASVAFLGAPNDGIISGSSAKLGNVRSIHVKANHVDFANHLLGLTGLFFDPLQFYKDYARDIASRGY